MNSSPRQEEGKQNLETEAARRRERLLTSILNQMERSLDPPTPSASDSTKPNREA